MPRPELMSNEQRAKSKEAQSIGKLEKLGKFANLEKLKRSATDIYP